jgi:hypothetical protein
MLDLSEAEITAFFTAAVRTTRILLKAFIQMLSTGRYRKRKKPGSQ